jgi:hypothetical protein
VHAPCPKQRVAKPGGADRSTEIIYFLKYIYNFFIFLFLYLNFLNNLIIIKIIFLFYINYIL